MRPLGVVEVDPLINDPLGDKAISHFMQIDSLVYKRAPQTFDKDGVLKTVFPLTKPRPTHLGLGRYAHGQVASLVGGP